MTVKQFVKVPGVVMAALTILLAGTFVSSPRERVQQHNDDDNDKDSTESKMRIGFQIAPVYLNLAGKDRNLVGLGSYIVNAQVDCNIFHSAGTAIEFASGGNPYFGQPKITNTATYLGGGRVFAPLVPGSASIVSRNLTPDKTGLPAGGHTFSEFLQIMRHGVDFDHLHPTCSGQLSVPYLGSRSRWLEAVMILRFPILTQAW